MASRVCKKKKKKQAPNELASTNWAILVKLRLIFSSKNYQSLVFKACVRYFYQIFIYSPNDNPSKTMKSTFYFI